MCVTPETADVSRPCRSSHFRGCCRRSNRACHRRVGPTGSDCSPWPYSPNQSRHHSMGPDDMPRPRGDRRTELHTPQCAACRALSRAQAHHVRGTVRPKPVIGSHHEPVGLRLHHLHPSRVPVPSPFGHVASPMDARHSDACRCRCERRCEPGYGPECIGPDHCHHSPPGHRSTETLISTRPNNLVFA